jgi:hypothetical protein
MAIPDAWVGYKLENDKSGWHTFMIVRRRSNWSNCTYISPLTYSNIAYSMSMPPTDHSSPLYSYFCSVMTNQTHLQTYSIYQSSYMRLYLWSPSVCHNMLLAVASNVINAALSRWLTALLQILIARMRVRVRVRVSESKSLREHTYESECKFMFM